MKILVLNLGSTSTKLGVFEDTRELLTHTLRHSKEELARFDGILGQTGFRKDALLNWLDENGSPITGFDAIAARGGLIRPVPGGSFLVDEAAVKDAQSGDYGMHAANLGMLIARELGLEQGIPAIFTDAPATDELSDTARVSGYQGITRRSVFHALNAKRVARLYCEEQGLDPYKTKLIVAHMGGGVSVCALDGLKAVDVNCAVEGDGPFSPERAGSLPLKQVLKLAKTFPGGPDALFEALYRQGGLSSYFKSNDVVELERRGREEPGVRLVLDAMLYNIAKQIAAMAVALQGKPRQVLLTGGIAYNREMMERLSGLVAFVAPCTIFPGEDELAALAEGAYRVLTGQEEARRVEG